MLYEKSLAINRRLDELLRLIRKGSHSTPTLAASLGVSIPTVSRCLKALRDLGHDIRPERATDGWHYVLITPTSKRKTRRSAEREASPDTQGPEPPIQSENVSTTGAAR